MEYACVVKYIMDGFSKEALLSGLEYERIAELYHEDPVLEYLLRENRGIRMLSIYTTDSCHI